MPKLLEPLYQQAFVSDYHWLAREAAELLSRLKPKSSYKSQIELLHCDNSIHSLVDIIQPQEAWEISLKALANLQKSPLEDVNSPAELRLAWFITFYNTQYILQPREQKLSKGK